MKKQALWLNCFQTYEGFDICSGIYIWFTCKNVFMKSCLRMHFDKNKIYIYV